MRAYSMDLRERALLDSDAGMKAADVAAKYRVSGSWVRLLKQRRRETGEVVRPPQFPWTRIWEEFMVQEIERGLQLSSHEQFSKRRID